MTDAICPECGRGFTPEEWDERHSAPSGEDVHVRCCRICEWDELNS